MIGAWRFDFDVAIGESDGIDIKDKEESDEMDLESNDDKSSVLESKSEEEYEE